MLKETERWLSNRSWSVTDRPLHRLMSAKRATGSSVSVVLPALNEEETVGEIVAIIRHDLMQQVPLVDEIVVVDSGSTDRTSQVAAAAARAWCTGTRSCRASRPCPARARCCGVPSS